MFTKITAKAIYSIFRNTITHGLYYINEENIDTPNEGNYSFDMTQKNTYRHVSIGSTLENPLDNIKKIDFIYNELHKNQCRVIIFDNPLLFSIAKKIILSHGYNIILIPCFKKKDKALIQIEK